MLSIPIILGKSISIASKKLKKGSGSTWPGEVALTINKTFVKKLLRKNPHLQIVLVAGTNGKTTTTKLLQEVLESQGKKVFRNAAGANLLNGLTSSLVKHATLTGKLNYDAAIFEIDENSLPIILNELTELTCPLSIILLNLFRDQLDRFGEVNSLVKKWQIALKKLPEKTLLIANGDDPMLRFLGEESGLTTAFFGISEKYMAKKNAPHDVDFLFCPHCATALVYKKRSYSHMGQFVCPKCGFENKKTETFETLPNPFLGNYNRYNINAATLLLQKRFDTPIETIKETLKGFSAAFGRQEKIKYKGKKVFLLLSKNPTSFNQSIEGVLEEDHTPHVLLLLNDRIPDGRDISWIWDVEFENLNVAEYITISGDRTYDMGLRIKYAQEVQSSKFKVQIEENTDKAINLALVELPDTKTLYILATYSAMLDARQILKGQKIL